MSTRISVNQASEILDLSAQRVRTLCREGLLGAEKVGNSWILDKKSVHEYGLRSGNQIATDHPAHLAKKRLSKPIALSFFSGAMGLDLGIEKAGFEIRLACESDRFCRQTIELNRPNLALLGDINSYSAQDILKAAMINDNEEVDLMVGGPPCQAFSTAGKRNGFNDDRGNVFLKYLELAFTIRPKFLVIENVRGLLSCPMNHRPHEQRGPEFPPLAEDEMKGGALNFVLNRLKMNGYNYSFNLYNSANFGTPQIRERVIIICTRDGSKPPFIVPTHSGDRDFNLPEWRSIKEVITGIKKHEHINFPEKRLRYYRLLKPGQNWRNLPIELQKEAMGKSFYSGGGKTGFLRRLDWNKPSPTLVTHPAMPATDLAHPEENRPLSIQEYMRIQEFPDDWKLAGSLIERYKQVGNAVPLGLGHAVGNLIMKLIKGENIPQFNDFKHSRYKRTSDTEWEQEFSANSSQKLPETLTA